jgi:predicted glycosyltransferase
MTPSAPRKVLFYVQHLLGVGHLARASRIARALIAAGHRVLMVTGGAPVPGFPGADIPVLALPPVAVSDGRFAGLVDGAGQPASEAYLADRRDRLLTAFRAFAPDVVVTEAFPFGRRQMRFELLPLLEAVAAARPRPRLVCSLRDILQKVAKPGRAAETAALVTAHYDRVLVHGDPAFARLEDSFPETAAIADRIAYTGLVCAPRPRPAAERFDVIVSAGGGAVGGRLSQAAVAAAADMPDLSRWLVIAGPNLPQATFDALAAAARPGVQVERFRPDFPALLAAARVSASQAGYNTAGDILQAGVRSVLVPYAEAGETEQEDRARRLAALGRAQVVTEAALTPGTLAAALRAALDGPPPAALPIDTGGAARSAALIAS